jgi:porphobilinogen synthase
LAAISLTSISTPTLGVNKFILFGVLPDEMKNHTGSGGYDPEGVVPRALRLLKDAFGNQILLFADVCLCEYTDHDYCSVVKENQLRDAQRHGGRPRT